MVFGTRLDPVLSASEAQSLLEIRFYSQSPDKRVQCILPLRNQPTAEVVDSVSGEARVNVSQMHKEQKFNKR